MKFKNGVYEINNQVDVYRYSGISMLRSEETPSWINECLRHNVIVKYDNIDMCVLNETRENCLTRRYVIADGDYIVNNGGHIEIWRDKDFAGYEFKAEN